MLYFRRWKVLQVVTNDDIDETIVGPLLSLPINRGQLSISFLHSEFMPKASALRRQRLPIYTPLHVGLHNSRFDHDSGYCV